MSSKQEPDEPRPVETIVVKQNRFKSKNSKRYAVIRDEGHQFRLYDLYLQKHRDDGAIIWEKQNGTRSAWTRLVRFSDYHS